jgi:diguanylate cyclase (GGDEF)-like protein
VSALDPDVLEALLGASVEPLLVAALDRPEWPVVFSNPAFDALGGETIPRDRPLADVVERLGGRELAVEVSEAIRTSKATSIPLEWHKRDYLLVVQPIASPRGTLHCALFWRNAAGITSAAGGTEMHQALMRARRRIRDLSRDDTVTGLFNESAFREVLAHDWAVAARERGTLALVAFQLEEFTAYVEVFGRHAADSCLRRVAQALKRHLRRASDVATRINRDEREYLVVLSHSSDEAGVREFAGRIAVAVRELGLHHPRSRASRFVTVSYGVALAEANPKGPGADRILDHLLQESPKATRVE